MRVVIALATALFIGTSAQALTVINGSFEQGIALGSSATLVTGDKTSITGWEVLSVGVDYAGTIWAASDGSRSVDLSALTSGGLKQRVAGFEAGKRYELTFDLSSNPDGPNGNLRALVSATSGDPEIFVYKKTAVNSATNMLFQSYTYTFIASGTTENIQFRSLQYSPFGVVLDNVAVSLVPEPAAWALLIAGFAMTGLAMRRRTVTVAA